LSRVRTTAIGAYLHQQVPFHMVVEALKPERDPSRNPVFQVLFALHEEGMREFELPSLKVSFMEIDPTGSPFDLSVHMWNGPSQMRVWFRYNTDLFNRETIEHMADCFDKLFEAVIEDPEIRLSAVKQRFLQLQSSRLVEKAQRLKSHGSERLQAARRKHAQGAI